MRSRFILVPEVREEKKRQSLLDNFNEKVYEFFELNTEFKSIESRISGEKRPKMDQIKTMEAYMNQQRDRKNFIEYDDLKVLEQHLADYLILQTDTHKDKATEKVFLSLFIIWEGCMVNIVWVALTSLLISVV